MLKNEKKKIVIGIIVFTIMAIIILVVLSKNNSVEALSKYGSRGSEVTQIQTKLKRWGYYNGNVDGIYGTQTLNAVKYFQRKNGLTQDGIAGPATLKAMGIYNSSSSSSSSSNSSNTGQVAVGAVVMNRVRSSSFPNSISGVIYQSGSFDAVRDGQINLSPDATAKKAAQDAINGWDPSYGAIYYFNPSTATNKWIWSRPMTITIGRHRFCK